MCRWEQRWEARARAGALGLPVRSRFVCKKALWLTGYVPVLYVEKRKNSTLNIDSCFSRLVFLEIRVSRDLPFSFLDLLGHPTCERKK